MDYRTLGRNGPKVSHFCLGTMTFGRQTNQDDSFRQLDMALAAGINFLDTAEMYPTNPVITETCGETEAIIGRWRAARGAGAENMLLATKCAGGNGEHLRPGERVTPAIMRSAVETSLARLKTDHIACYQLHWPTRPHYHFRRYWKFKPEQADVARERDDLHALVGCVTDLVAEGKIGVFGLSNETAWGMMEWQRVAEASGGARVSTVQNEYSLMCRIYDTDLAEVSHYEDIGLLAFSPLAAGMLTGKYSGNVTPPLSRRAATPDLGGRMTEPALAAADAYVALAREHDVHPVHMALAFCTERPFMASAIIGATNIGQLQTILEGADFTLTSELRAGIDKIFRQFPRPM